MFCSLARVLIKKHKDPVTAEETHFVLCFLKEKTHFMFYFEISVGDSGVLVLYCNKILYLSIPCTESSKTLPT